MTYLEVEPRPSEMRGEAPCLRDADALDAPPPIVPPVETHWSRILYHDLLMADTRGKTSNPGEIVQGAIPSPTPVSRMRISRRECTSWRKAERVTLSAADGYPITGIHYAATGPTRAHLIVAGAVGVPQRFYRRFAEFAASNGFSTMTLDYRGLGLSAPPDLAGFRMDYFDWGRLDLAAAVNAMSAAGPRRGSAPAGQHSSRISQMSRKRGDHAGSPDVPLYVIGHSFGGHAFGVLPNHDKVSGFYTFGTGADWHGWMPPLERIKVLAMWHLLGPVLIRWKGYLSWSALGMGEDLPLDFYRRSRRWCRYPNYFFGDPSVRYVARSFDRVRAPLMAANAIDDRWAPPKSRDAFITSYRNAVRQTLDIDPTRVGLRAIGHMGYFKPDAAPLWESALAWFETREAARSRGASPSAASRVRAQHIRPIPLNR